MEELRQLGCRGDRFRPYLNRRTLCSYPCHEYFVWRPIPESPYLPGSEHETAWLFNFYCMAGQTVFMLEIKTMLKSFLSKTGITLTFVFKAEIVLDKNINLQRTLRVSV